VSRSPNALAISLVVALGVVGVAAGFGLARLASAPAGDPAASADPVAALQSTGEPRSTECPTDLDGLRDQLAAITTQARLAEGQLASIGGLPSPWPDPDAAAEREATLRVTLAAAFAEVPVLEAWELDCDEDPCLLAYAVPRQSGAFSAAQGAGFASIMGGSGTGRHAGQSVDYGFTREAASAPSGPTEARAERRLADLAERLVERVAAARAPDAPPTP
jgi:hypothetical protein